MVYQGKTLTEFKSKKGLSMKIFPLKKHYGEFQTYTKVHKIQLCTHI